MVKLFVRAGEVWVQYMGRVYSETLFAQMFPEVYEDQIVSRL